MSKTDAFQHYWMTIDINEEYLRSHGHLECFDYENKSHPDLLDADREVQKYLKTVNCPRMFDGPAANLRISAQNYHEALISVLNPPERWFRQLEMLNSPEYLALKDGAKSEEDRVLSLDNKSKTYSETKTKSRKKNSPSKSKDPFTPNMRILLDLLLNYHGCNTNNPNNSPLSQTKIQKMLREKDVQLSQATVSRTMDSLMEKAPYYSGLDGAKKYKQLCDQSQICIALSGLHVKSNQFLDRGLHEKYERSDEYIEQHSERGY